VSDRDLDAEFARIIAGWDEEAPDPQPHGVGGAARTDGRAQPDEAAAPDPDASSAGAEPGGAPPERPERDPELEHTEQSEPAHPEHPEHPEPEQPERERPQGVTGNDPAAPPPQPTPGAAAPSSSSGLLELPIAPTTSHAWRASTPPRDEARDVADDDHFVPPSEIDLPSAETDPMFWAIVGGLAGGPLLLLYVLFFDRDGSGWWVVTAVTMLVVGFVLLVLRGGNERDPFDDGTRV
jgi:hypothetical protein